MTQALRDAGVAEADVQTSELSLAPRYGERGDPELPVGYVASNVVTARVRDLDALGAVIGAATGAGANRIDGLSFALSDPGPAREQARRLAVADAVAAAETLADAAGRGLGPALRIEEGGGGPRPFPADAMLRAEAAPVPTERGEVETTANVRMEFTLDPVEGRRRRLARPVPPSAPSSCLKYPRRRRTAPRVIPPPGGGAAAPSAARRPAQQEEAPPGVRRRAGASRPPG